MTALEAYDMITSGGGNDFSEVVELCESFGEYCLIGGLAVNCYVEPVYTMDADLVMIASQMEDLAQSLADDGFKVERFPHSINAQKGASDLRIQFTTDTRYEDFPARASRHSVLGCNVMVASLEDVARGKLWAWSDSTRRLSKRKKDELDLIRLAEAYPHLKATLPDSLNRILEEG